MGLTHPVRNSNRCKCESLQLLHAKYGLLHLSLREKAKSSGNAVVKQTMMFKTQSQCGNRLQYAIKGNPIFVLQARLDQPRHPFSRIGPRRKAWDRGKQLVKF